jgi:hypothetical protein
MSVHVGVPPSALAPLLLPELDPLELPLPEPLLEPEPEPLPELLLEPELLLLVLLPEPELLLLVLLPEPELLLDAPELELLDEVLSVVLPREGGGALPVPP